MIIVLPRTSAFGIVQFGTIRRKVERNYRRHDAKRKMFNAALDAL